MDGELLDALDGTGVDASEIRSSLLAAYALFCERGQFFLPFHKLPNIFGAR